MNDALKKNAIYNIAYNLFNALFPIISIAYVSRTLSPNGVGIVAYVLNIASYFVSLAPMGIPTYGQKIISQAKDISRVELSNRFSELVVINSISTVLSVVTYYGMIILVPFFYSNKRLYFIAGISVVVNFLNFDWFYRGIENFKYITLRNFATKVISFFLVLLFVKTESDLSKYLLIVCGVASLNNIANTLYLKKYVSFNLHIRFVDLKKHFMPILFLFLSLIAGDIYSKMDITMIGAMCSDKEVGLYSSAYKIVNMILVVVTSITAVSLPMLSKFANSNKNDYSQFLSKLINDISVLCFPACIGLALISKDLVLVFLGTDYVDASISLSILSSLIVIKGLGDLLAYQHVVAIGREKMLVPIRVVSVFINFFLNYFLISFIGFNGAALATIITEAITLCYILLCLKKEKYFYIKINNVFSIVIGCLVMMIAVYACSNFKEIWVRLFFGVCLGGLVYFLVLMLLRNDIMECIWKNAI